MPQTPKRAGADYSACVLGVYQLAITAAQLSVEFTSSGAAQVEGEIKSVGDAVQAAGSRFDDFYDNLKSIGTGSLNALKGVSQVLGSIAAVGGVTLLAGGAKAAFAQVSAVEQATVALRAYEKDATKVNKVLADLVDYAQSDLGVLFQRQDLFRAAQSLAVFGRETDKLSESVQIMSRAVGLGTVRWDELSRIIGRVLATGRLAGNEFDELTKAGYQLDDSLRNTAISADELFDALDRGIPADALAGQADTIEGRLIRLQSAIRNLGNAFLGVDPATSQFVSGSLGAQLVAGLSQARDVLASMQPLAEGIGAALATSLQMISNAVGGLVDLFQMLPGPIQGTIGVLGGLALALGAVTSGFKLLSAVAGAAGLSRVLGAMGLSGEWLSLGRVARSTGGIMVAALTVAAGAAIGMYDRTQDMIAASKELDAVWRDLQLLGDDESANNLKQVREEINGIINDLESGIGPDWLPFPTGGETIPADIKKNISQNLTRIFTDAQIDATAFVDWVNSELARIGDDPELQREFLKELADPDLILRFRDEIDGATDGADALNAALERTAATAEDIAGIFADLPTTVDDLRIDGLTKQADDIERLGESLERAFTTPYQASSMDFEQDAFQPHIDGMTEMAMISEESAGILETSWNRIQDALASGDFDNARLIADIFEVLGDTSLNGDQKVAEIQAISNSLADYSTAINAAQEAMIEWLSEGDNILEWWLEYNEAMNQGAAMLDGTQEQLDALQAKADFRALVQFTSDLQEASRALDSILNTYSQIDSLAQRSSAAGSIADALFGKDGDPSDGIGPLRDVFDAGLISVEQFNQAIADGIAIQESNAQTQLYLNKIRADQLPLLAAEQAAYEENIRQLSELGPLEQRRALAMQDSGVQAQIASMYSTAYAASLGEIPPEVATNMIVSAAEADPVLKDLLLQFGLIEEGADGEIRVNFPDGDTVQDSIMQLTQSIDALTVAIGGVPPVRIEAEDNASAVIDSVMGKLSGAAGWVGDKIGGALGIGGGSGITGLPSAGHGPTVTINAEDLASPVIDTVTDALNNMDGSSATVSTLGDNGDALAAIDQTGMALSDIDGQSSLIHVDGDNANAMAAIDEIAAYNGMVLATAYVDIVARQIGSGQAIAQGIVAGARQGLGIHSPSREFAEIGKYTAMGFQQGWEREFENPSIGLSTAAAYSGYGVAASGTSSGGGVHIAPNAVNITVNAGAGADADEIAQTVTRTIMPALADEFRRHTTAHSEVMA